MPPLRASQVETLRAVEDLTVGPYVWVSAAMVAGHVGLTARAAYERLVILEDRRFLESSYSRGRCFYRLTQLGREALEAEGD